MKSMSLRSWRKLDVSISQKINEMKKQLEATASLSAFEQNPASSFDAKRLEVIGAHEVVIQLIEVRKGIRDAVDSANDEYGITSLISERKYLEDTAAVLTIIISKTTEYMPEHIFVYFEAKKDKFLNTPSSTSSNRFFSSGSSADDSITIPVFNKEHKDSRVARLKSINTKLTEIEEKLTTLNVTSTAEILDDEELEFLGSVGLV